MIKIAALHFAGNVRVSFSSKRVACRAFFDMFFPGREMSYYGGPEPLEMEDLGVDLITSVGGSQRVLRGSCTKLGLVPMLDADPSY